MNDNTHPLCCFSFFLCFCPNGLKPALRFVLWCLNVVGSSVTQLDAPNKLNAPNHMTDIE